MKELLKTNNKSKGIRDPVRKSPVFGSVSTVPTSGVNITRQDCEKLHAAGGSKRNGRRKHLKINTGSKVTKTPSSTKDFHALHEHHHGSKKTDILHEHCDSTILGWDLTSEESECEYSRSCLENARVLGEDYGVGTRKSVGESASVLHNWKNSDHGVRGHVNTSIIEGLQLEASSEAWNRKQSKACQDENGRLKSMGTTSRLIHGHMLKRNEQVFSPLVLDPGEEMHSFIPSQPSFTLEEPFHYNEEGSDTTNEWPSGVVLNGNEPLGRKPSLRSHVHHLSSHESHRSQRKQSGNIENTSKTIPMLSHSASYIARQRRSHNSRPIPWESTLFDNEVNTVQLPFKKESEGIQHHSKHSKKPDTRHLFSGRENLGLPPDSKSSTRRRSNLSSEAQSMLLSKQLRRVSYPHMKAEAEPFLFLTELDDYNGSDDDLVASSNDGPSMGELEGELELESGNDAPDRHNTGKIVRVANVEECQLTIPDCKELALCEYKPRNLSQKYRPKVFEDIVGQRIVTQALSNAISKGKIAPVYLFQGSRGTGKTSAARIFASALLCLSTESKKPCGVCKECISVALGKCPEVREVDAASNNGIERVKGLLEETLSPTPSPYKVFIIDECHVLATETWNALLKILEEPPMNVVFILITTDPDRLPRTVVSRCHKFLFPKIRDSEIVKRLQKLAMLEDLAVDIGTLQLIASRSDGSLRDAEITLDQVSLLGQQINSSTVQELVGSASDEKMLSLLDSALQASTVTTVRKARELIDSGLEPLSLMSQLATLITDILAGSFKFTDKQRRGFFQKQFFSEEKLERLRMAMKTLSEAEKQLRASNDRATWLTAALLQLGPDHSSYICTTSCAGTSVTQSPVDDGGENEATDIEHHHHHQSSEKKTWVAENTDTSFSRNVTSEFLNLESKDEHNGIGHEKVVYWTKGSSSQGDPQGRVNLQRHSHESVQQVPETSCFQDRIESGSFIGKNEVSHSKLDDIWHAVIEKCRLQPLKQFLFTSVKLISIAISEVNAIVNLEVCYPDHKLNCERSQKSIASLFESVIGFPIEIRTTLASLPQGIEKLGATQGSVIKDYDEKLSRTIGINPTSMHDMGSLYQNRTIYNFPHKLPSNYITQDMENEPCFGRERRIGDIEALSLESHELAVLPDKNRSTSYIINGRRSYDAYPPKMMETSSFKMAHQMSVNSNASAHADRSNSLIKLPRFSTKNTHTTPTQIQTYVESPKRSDVRTFHKKSKFKGTFARFFQGKLTKHG